MERIFHEEVFRSQCFERLNKTKKSFKNRKIRICLFSNRQNQLHPSNSDRQLQTVGLQPPIKGVWPHSWSEVYCPIWRSEWMNWKTGDIVFSSKRKYCEAIAHNASDTIYKVTSQISHRKINGKGWFPTILVIPVTKSIVTFSNLDYLWIKRIIDKAKVNYSRVTIIQSYDLKERLK